MHRGLRESFVVFLLPGFSRKWMLLVLRDKVERIIKCEHHFNPRKVGLYTGTPVWRRMHESHHCVKGNTSLLSQCSTARLEAFLFWASVKGSVHIFVFFFLASTLHNIAIQLQFPDVYSLLWCTFISCKYFSHLFLNGNFYILKI